jgi:hypothetical protein
MALQRKNHPGERPAVALPVLTLILALCPATPAVQFAGGTGEPNNPYQIATAEQLIALGQDPNLYDRHFVLVADLDLDPNLPGGRVFGKAIIAPDFDAKSGFQGSAFTGSFDGREHTISGLTIVTNTQYAGLFGATQSTANIQNLTLERVSVTSTSGIGALVGENRGLVEACHSKGMVNGTSGVGGLVGGNFGSIVRCSSTATVHGSRTVGGLVGSSLGLIVGSCAKGHVIGTSTVGGLLGGGMATVSACYSTATVNAVDSAGGLVGYTTGTLLRSFSAGPVNADRYFGGFLGEVRVGMGRAINCIFDNMASGQLWDYQAVGLSTEEMRDPNILALNGWTHDPNWVLDNGRDYPRLAWEKTSGRAIPEPNLEWLQGAGTAKDPYVLHSAEQIVLLSKAPLLWDHDFVVDANIDLDPNLPGRCTFYQPMIMDFHRVFDGGGHVIRNLTIIGNIDVGLFGRLGLEADVRNINLQGAVTEGAEGGYCVGALAGENTGKVSACHATAVVRGGASVGGLIGGNTGSISASSCAGSVSGTEYVGGLIGGNSGSISASSSTGLAGGTQNVGGLVGYNTGAITRCCSRDVDVSGDTCAGGFVGENGYRTGVIEACYATGAVQGISYVGGFAGWNGFHPPVVRSILVQASVDTSITYGTIRQCYAACSVTGQQQVGDFLGSAAASANAVQESCFFLAPADADGTDNGFGMPLTTEQMRQQASFIAWDFEDVWTICEGRDYPRLRWEGVTCEGGH